MPDNLKPDSPSRRAIVVGLAAAPIALSATATAAGVSDDLSDLNRLIEDHRAAYAAFIKAIDQQQEVEDAYEAAHDGTVLVPSLLGGGLGMSNGYEVCRGQIAAGYDTQRARLAQLSRVDPDLAEQVRTVMDAKEAENMLLVDRVFAEENARQEAFGLAAAQRSRDDASDAEEDAVIAICTYPCRTIEGARVKAAYLAIAPGLGRDLQTDHIELLLQSFTVGDANV